MKKSTINLLLVMTCMFVWACGGGSNNSEEAQQEEEVVEEESEEEQNPFAAMQNAMEQVETALEESGGNIEPVGFRKLKALLPEEAAGFERKSSEGEKAGAMGIKMSTATGEYEDGDGGQLDVSIVDMGSMTNFAGMGMAAWLMADIDRESDTEIERTFTYRGQKAYEQFNTEYKTGTLSFVVENRFVVSIESEGVEQEDVKEFAEEIDIDALAEMKDEGVKE
ncbi:transposase [Flammeovirgaceae bacterium SG7u.111]|nr:transposase [Flammeovirgaceae bacterium SG7u.132]WPO37492.1 transposase [Flammeovirgaceae bacterium SG7u.111]